MDGGKKPCGFDVKTGVAGMKNCCIEGDRAVTPLKGMALDTLVLGRLGSM